MVRKVCLVFWSTSSLARAWCGEARGRAEAAVASRRMAEVAAQWLVDATDGEEGCGGGFRWGGEVAGRVPLLGVREP
jgi:hypothetical protein